MSCSERFRADIMGVPSIGMVCAPLMLSFLHAMTFFWLKDSYVALIPGVFSISIFYIFARLTIIVLVLLDPNYCIVYASIRIRYSSLDQVYPHVNL
ncbi:hypothetical protein BDR03DRAFT_946110 [Suillus americanus]|nr:hypothetical protein BDR03DRAFT_946110 [Suillus americanus]